MAKVRADQRLFDLGLADSRTRAQALILSGNVFAADRRIDKAGQFVADDAVLFVKGRDHPWVSRGGVKLAHGLAQFGWNVTGAIAMDVGSSTGGFTDVLLTSGAAKVYAIDSGTNQLAWKLRQDILTDIHIPEPIDLFVCDASFIGLAKVLDRPLTFATPTARLMALIKPQFEVGREQVGKGGVVRDPALHASACANVRTWIEAQGWIVDGIVESPIKGPEGNIEFLIAANRTCGG